MAEHCQRPLIPAPLSQSKHSQASDKAARAFKDIPILVYTMGKVGSTAVYEALSTAGLAERVFHLHCLRADDFANYRKVRKAHNLSDPEHLYDGEAVLEQMQANPGHPIKVITLVRDPVAREISAMFENRLLVRHVLDENKAVIAELAINYLTAQLVGPESCVEFFRWFDRGPRHTFGIDIRDTPFPKERGWQVYRNGAVEMLLIRLEDLSRTGPEVITEFLEISSPIEFPPSRVRQEDAYPLVRDGVKLPVEVCERIFRSPLITHLYDNAAIDGMISRWRISDDQAGDAQEYIRDAILKDLKSYRIWAAKTIEGINADRAKRLEANQQLHSTCGRLGQQNEQLRQRNEQLLQQVECLGRRLQEVRQAKTETPLGIG